MIPAARDKKTTCPSKTRTREDMVIAAIDPEEGRRHICFGSCLPEGADWRCSYTLRNEANKMRNSLETTTTICTTLFAWTDVNVYFPNVYFFDQKPSKTQELLAKTCVSECRAAIFASRTIRVFSVSWSHTSPKMCYTHKCEGRHRLHIFNHNQSLWVPVHTGTLPQTNKPGLCAAQHFPTPPLPMECPQPQVRVERRLKPDEWRSGTACSPGPYFTPPSLIKMRCGTLRSQGSLFQLREEGHVHAGMHGRSTGQRVVPKLHDWLILQRFLPWSIDYIPE